MKITESRTSDILHWLDDMCADPIAPFHMMANYRDAAALIRQLQAAEQAAWHAGLDADREQGRGNEHAHQPPSAPVGVEALKAARDMLLVVNRTLSSEYPHPILEADVSEVVEEVESALAQQRAAHPDDAAVDAFAVAMKEKLAAARAKGRGGWNGNEPGMQQRLSDMLRAHVDKGDPRDVANLSMFLHQRGEAILPAQQPAAVDGAMVERVAALLHGEATDEPWTVAGVEHGGPDRDYYRKLARKVIALAAQPGGSDNDC